MTTFLGYSGQIWGTVSSVMSYYLAQIENAESRDTISMTTAALETLLNAVQAINANTLVTTWDAEAANLEGVQALPIVISSDDTAILNNRVDAFLEGAAALRPLVPTAPYLPGNLSIAKGQPAIPDMELLMFYRDFSYETPPSGTTMANMIDQAVEVGAAFERIAAAILTLQGEDGLTSAYDVATRQAEVSASAAGILVSAGEPLSENAPVSGTWNQVATLPALTMDSSILGTTPFTYQAQQSGVIRNAILTMAFQLAAYLLALRRPNFDQAALAQVRQGDNLMDIANRSMGDYEQWRALAAANNLLPPWISREGSAVSGVAGWGQDLVLPTPGTSRSAAGMAPSYLANFLGIDLYIGKIDGPMPPWGGDFQIITGYDNLRWALGRRLQTTLGTLVYHPDYGSKVPPEVGAVQDLQTVEHITAYAISAILSDPRVSSVPFARAARRPNGLVEFSGTVQPSGFGSPTAVNQVIGPL